MKVLIATTLAFMVLPAFAQEQSEGPVETVKKLEQEFREALLRGDTEALGKMLTDDFIRTPPTTPDTTKTQWLESIRTGKQKYLSFDIKKATYRAFGDTVLVNAVVNLRVRRADQQEADLQLRLLQVWVKQNGRWLLAAIQGNQAPSP